MKNLTLEEILEYEQPTKYIVKSEQYKDEYDIPVLTAGKSFILGYTNEEDGIYNASKTNPIILFDDFTTNCKYVDFNFKVKSSAAKILKLKGNEANLKYLYYCLKSIIYDTSSHKRYWISQYSKFKINLPDISYQNNIVSKIEKIEEIIDIKEKQINKIKELIISQFNTIFGHPIDNNRWEQKKLNNVCDVRDGTHDSPKYYSEGYLFVTSKNLINEEIDFSTCNYINKEDYDKINKRSKVDDGDILMPMIGTIGGAIIVKKDREFAIKNVALIKFKNNDINNVFLKYLLNSQEMNDYFNNIKKGGIQKFISLTTIRNLPIIVPPIELQRNFSCFVQENNKLILICEKELKKLEELKDSKMQEYFGGAVYEQK